MQQDLRFAAPSTARESVERSGDGEVGVVSTLLGPEGTRVGVFASATGSAPSSNRSCGARSWVAQ